MPGSVTSKYPLVIPPPGRQQTSTSGSWPTGGQKRSAAMVSAPAGATPATSIVSRTGSSPATSGQATDPPGPAASRWGSESDGGDPPGRLVRVPGREDLQAVAALEGVGGTAHR